MGDAMGQNLVPNGGFETISVCDLYNFPFYSNYVPPWFSPYGSPDAFDTCMNSINWLNGVPTNLFGHQVPHSGSGYAGVGVYVPTNPNYREYIEVELDSPLVFQQIYCGGFYIACANVEKIACNNIGMYFSDTLVPPTISAFIPLPFIPQINETSVITDTLNWTLVSGQYIAHGGERYIIIGNFYSNALTDTVHVSGWDDEAYYYIDDVSVVSCGTVGEKEINPTPELTLYPNPCASQLGIRNYELGIKEVKIYDVLGERIRNYELGIRNGNIETIDVSKLPSGLYFAELLTDKGVVRRKFVKE